MLDLDKEALAAARKTAAGRREVEGQPSRKLINGRGLVDAIIR